MNKRIFITVIVLTTIGLIGVIAIQFYWFHKALQLKEDQFSNQTQIILKEVVDKLFIKQSTYLSVQKPGEELDNKNVPNILSAVDTAKLRSLLEEKFRNQKMESSFEYGIFNLTTRQLIFKQHNSNPENIVTSSHRIALSNMGRSNSFVLAVYIKNEKEEIRAEMIPVLVLFLALVAGLAVLFGFVVYNLKRQKKLGDMKTDFVNNMTHELKTPISTISIATEMLIKPEVNTDANRVGRYARMIYDENNRLRLMVERVLQIAVIEKGEYNLRLRDTDVHELIHELVQKFLLTVRSRGGNMCVSLQATRYILKVDKIHFNNIISNLFDNANKYSLERPHITVKTWSDEKGFYVSVEDQGIGISAEHQKHIFRNLYRVPAKHIHNVKGFGLGLYYVKTLTQAHGGTVKVYSELEKGSRFELFFPFNYQNSTADEQENDESQPIVG
ncbi:MAG: HAMP domain-containing sensor histidine kinase [Bacteroidota bacterium]|nr:HAMP domain-containing sensor histidine kinase [Bacteroidota bacterium]